MSESTNITPPLILTQCTTNEEENSTSPVKTEQKVEPKHKTSNTKDPRRPFRWKPEAAEHPISTPPDFNKWNSHKAGLEQVDKARVQEIVTSLTEGSSHYERQKQKAKERKARINAIMEKVNEARASPERLRRRQYIVDHNVIPDMEFRRLQNHVRVCVDFDCFYAAVEAQDNPALVGRPHAVSMGPGKHSILATSSYEARKYGVRSGMPVFIGESLCPHMIIMPARMGRYSQVSKIMESVLVKYDPDYAMGSLDEAFLDITQLVSDKRPAYDVVNDLRRDIQEATGGLTVSAGCGPNLLIAKIGADMKKPNGQTILLPAAHENDRDYCIKFMSTLPLRKVPGIGEYTESLMHALGYKVVGDIYSDRATIAEVFTPYRTRLYLRYTLGLGCIWTDTYDERMFVRKGIGCNRTFGRENNEEKLFKHLRRIAEILEHDMTDAGAVGARTFTLRLKTSGFVSFGRSVTLPPGAMVCTADDFELFGRKILRNHMPIELRRIGMKLHKITWRERPKDSIKRFLVNDDVAAEIESKDWKSSAQIIQARERAKRFFRDEFIVEVRSKEVSFRASTSCQACCNEQKKNGVKHALPYSCPVCRTRCFKYLSALNEHMDECLGGERKVSVKQEKRAYLTLTQMERNRAVKKEEQLEQEEERVMRNMKSENMELDSVTGVKRELMIAEIDEHPAKKIKCEDVISSSETRKQWESSDDFTCPICKVEQFYDNTELNTHVDVCLNLNSDVLNCMNDNTRQSLKREHSIQSKRAITSFYKKKKRRTFAPSTEVKPNSAPKSERTTRTIICPVCKVTSFKNPKQLDLHVDECLSVKSGLLKATTAKDRIK